MKFILIRRIICTIRDLNRRQISIHRFLLICTDFNNLCTSLVRSALSLCKSMKTIIDRDIVYVYIYIYTRINFFSASIHIPARSCVRDRAIYLGSVRKRIRNMISTHVRRKKFNICGALLRIGILALWDYHYVWQISIIERLHVSGTKSGNIV